VSRCGSLSIKRISGISPSEVITFTTRSGKISGNRIPDDPETEDFR
jgi:hypothetical protein